jgi:dihydroorotate dehydrogenase (NAD+) catalytic subunit
VLLLNASGCLDATLAPDVARAFDVFVTKTVTPLPRAGNSPVRIAETDAGMVNAIGLANPGIERFVDTTLPELRRLGLRLWVSAGGFSAVEFREVCEILDDHSAVEAIELNVSCPNVDEAPESVAEIVRASRVATRKPLFVKLPPAVPDVAELARATEAAGADGLSLVNTIRGLVLDERMRPRLACPVGGYSGPALKPIALAAVFTAYSATQLPIVAMGGIASGRDALEFVAAGATHVALGTVLFADPDAPARVRAELAADVAARGFAAVDEARGIAHDGGSTVAGRPRAATTAVS